MPKYVVEGAVLFIIIIIIIIMIMIIILLKINYFLPSSEEKNKVRNCNLYLCSI